MEASKNGSLAWLGVVLVASAIGAVGAVGAAGCGTAPEEAPAVRRSGLMIDDTGDTGLGCQAGYHDDGLGWCVLDNPGGGDPGGAAIGTDPFESGGGGPASISELPPDCSNPFNRSLSRRVCAQRCMDAETDCARNCENQTCDLNDENGNPDMAYCEKLKYGCKLDCGTTMLQCGSNCQNLPCP